MFKPQNWPHIYFFFLLLQNHLAFFNIKTILELYDLPNPYELLKNPPSKEHWKSSSNKSINKYTENSWENEINGKSSLKYLNQDILSVGKPHPVWVSVRYNIKDRKSAELKVKLLTGSYTLQANRANFNQYTVNPTCKLCSAEPKDRPHFLARCTFLESIRSHYREIKIKNEFL